MARIAPLFFVHGSRVVRGSLKRRVANHKMEIKAINYVLPDGSDQPIYLDFKVVLGHEQTFADAGAALALVPSKPKRRSRK